MENKKLLNEIRNTYDIDLYWTGSRVLPFVTPRSSSDYDIVVFTNDVLDAGTISLVRCDLKAAVANEYNIKIPNIDFRIAYFESPVTRVMTHWIKELDSEHKVSIPSIFDNKRSVLLDAKYYVQNLYYSRYYLVYLNLCVLENNSFELTEEQKLQYQDLYNHKLADKEYFTEEMRDEFISKIDALLDVIKKESN